MTTEITQPAPQPDGPGAGAAALALAPAVDRAESWRVAAAVAWALACSALVAALMRVPGAAWWAMGAYHLGCAAATASLARPRPTPAPRLPVAKLAAVAGGSLAVVVLGGALAVPLVDWQPAAALWRTWGLRPPADLVWLLYYASVNPWVEERFWRGTLHGDAVRARLGTRGARALILVAFLSHHAVVLVPSFGVARGLLLCVPVFFAGAVWLWLRERSGRLGWCIASHAGADAGLVVLYLLGPRGS
jgi:hypothetical protein